MAAVSSVGRLRGEQTLTRVAASWWSDVQTTTTGKGEAADIGEAQWIESATVTRRRE